MDSLSDTTWDVVLAGTGISQSLLALALSRSGKKVLHVDKNDYYGGAEAVLSLQEIEPWVEAVNNASSQSPFRDAVLSTPNASAGGSVLGLPRAYSISLSPQLIYTRCNLLPALVTSKVYRQLEFMAVGSWWVYVKERSTREDNGDSSISPSQESIGKLSRIPGGREDVFADKSVDIRSKRSLMKLLKLAADPEVHIPFLDTWGFLPFHHVLETHFKIPPELQPPIFALTSSPYPPSRTNTHTAITRIHRHLTSIGLFGPGFGSVIPKWGGLSEISQVACRAGAVGGGVYVLKQGIASIDVEHHAPEDPLNVCLQGGNDIKTSWVVGTQHDLPGQNQEATSSRVMKVSRSITIVSSSLPALFPLPAEGAPSPAGAVIIFPTGSLDAAPGSTLDDTPVYLIVHSSDTGECPSGQSIIYASTYLREPGGPTSLDGSTPLTIAVQKYLATIPEYPKPAILLSLHYTQLHTLGSWPDDSNTPNVSSIPIDSRQGPPTPGSHIIRLPDIAPDVALDDSLLIQVKDVWEKIVGEETGDGFMAFEDREGMGEGREEEEDEEDAADDELGESAR